jgi:hypothetical protein
MYTSVNPRVLPRYKLARCSETIVRFMERATWTCVVSWQSERIVLSERIACHWCTGWKRQDQCLLFGTRDWETTSRLSWPSGRKAKPRTSTLLQLLIQFLIQQSRQQSRASLTSELFVARCNTFFYFVVSGLNGFVFRGVRCLQSHMHLAI